MKVLPLGLFALFSINSAFAKVSELPEHTDDFLVTYCLDCHDEESRKGGINLELFEIDWTDPHWSAEGGESLAQLHSRVAGYLDRLRAEPPAAVVALVTHGDTIRAAQAVVAGLGPDELPGVTPHNGTVTRLVLS